MNANEQPVVYFPLMHAACAPGAISPHVTFLDPGCVRPEAWKTGRFFRPEHLPFEDARARRFLQDSLEFGSRFTRPADMAAGFRAVPADDIASESMQAIKSELLSPGLRKAGEERKVVADAQLVLLLGFHLEEEMLEMDGLASRIHASASDFSRSLGLDEDDQFPVDPALSGQDLRPEFTPDWRRLLPSFLRFLPEHACLVVTDPDILSELVEQGMHLTLCSGEEVAPLFPGWEPAAGAVFSKNSVTCRELSTWAGVPCPEGLEEKAMTLVTALLPE